MSITPWHGPKEREKKEGITDILNQGRLVALEKIRKSGFCARVSEVKEGTHSGEYGTLLFVHNIYPEDIIKED